MRPCEPTHTSAYLCKRGVFACKIADLENTPYSTSSESSPNSPYYAVRKSRSARHRRFPLQSADNSNQLHSDLFTDESIPPPSAQFATSTLSGQRGRPSSGSSINSLDPYKPRARGAHSFSRSVHCSCPQWRSRLHCQYPQWSVQSTRCGCLCCPSGAGRPKLVATQKSQPVPSVARARGTQQLLTLSLR
jgi:hypothetical protein